MLIRSQSGIVVTTDLNLFVKEGNNAWHIENNQFYLGIYSTREKAIKVLDIVQDAYSKCESVKALSSGVMVELAKVLNKEKVEEYNDFHRSVFVFQMPKDEDVEV